MNNPCQTTYRLNEYQAEHEAAIEEDEVRQKIRDEVERELMVGRECRYFEQRWTLADVNMRVFNSDAYDRYLDWRGMTDNPRTIQRLDEAYNRLWERKFYVLRDEIAELILRGGR